MSRFIQPEVPKESPKKEPKVEPNVEPRLPNPGKYTWKELDAPTRRRPVWKKK